MNIPTGAPRRYCFEKGAGTALTVADAAYLGDQDAIAAAMAAVAAQAGTH